MPIQTEERDITVIDHARARELLGHDDHRMLTDVDRTRLRNTLDVLHYDGCITETAMRRVEIVANGGHVTAVVSMACREADANRANARAVAEIVMVLVVGRVLR